MHQSQRFDIFVLNNQVFECLQWNTQDSQIAD